MLAAVKDLLGRAGNVPDVAGGDAAVSLERDIGGISHRWLP
jgi:hypothetical protein